MDQYRQLLDDVDVDDELLVCAAGFEPATPCAQDTCATTALRTEVVGGVKSRVFMMARSIHEKNARLSELSVRPDVCSHGSLHTHDLKALHEGA